MANHGGCLCFRIDVYIFLFIFLATVVDYYINDTSLITPNTICALGYFSLKLTLGWILWLVLVNRALIHMTQAATCYVLEQ